MSVRHSCLSRDLSGAFVRGHYNGKLYRLEAGCAGQQTASSLQALNPCLIANSAARSGF
jgi:hypothetical protein